MIRKIKTSLTAKLFLATTVLLILVCLLSVFSMARYIPQTYSNRLSAELQKQANDLVPVLEKAGSLEECYSLVQQFTAQTKATAYIEDDYGDILYSSDKLTITTDKDSIATIQENPDSAIITSDELLTEAGYVFTLLGSDYTLYVQSDTVSVNQATEAIWQTVPLVILGIFFMSILFHKLPDGRWRPARYLHGIRFLHYGIPLICLWSNVLPKQLLCIRPLCWKAILLPI